MSKKLTPEQVSQLSTGKTTPLVKAEKIKHNGVELDFYHQDSITGAELALQVGEALKSSPEIKRLVCLYLPQLEDSFQQLPGITSLEMIGLVMNKCYPSFENIS